VTERVACSRPCRACPWRKDTHARDIPNFSLELAENLANTSPDASGMGPDFGAPLFACHDSREGSEIACAGWMAQVGAAHPGVRLMAMQGRIDESALQPEVGWPELHESFADVIAQLREQCCA
jgi:hypothetical protein